MISVCMASFNGSKYIAQQLQSILIQLEPDDEVVIVDDASQDDTVSKISDFNDPRVRLFENDINYGVIAAFERSLVLARGDYIFLSDQDDVWRPDKVSKMMDCFTKYPEVTLCLSDCLIIDGSGKINAKTYFETRGSFKHGITPNIIKNKFLGCSIAFRKTMICHILPIPGKIPAHDMWIGLINEIYGRTALINETLFDYRRHSDNVSSMTHESVITMLRWRIILIYQLSLRVVKVFFQSVNKKLDYNKN